MSPVPAPEPVDPGGGGLVLVGTPDEGDSVVFTGGQWEPGAPAGGAVDPLRVPQYLTYTERRARSVILAAAAPVAITADTYSDYFPFDSMSYEVTGAGSGDAEGDSDIFTLEADGSVTIEKPGIYRLRANASVENDATGTYRALEIYISGLLDEAPGQAPAWETLMGSVTANAQIVVPPGSPAKNAGVYFVHDATSALDVTAQFTVFVDALFESLD